jgi:acyl-coenzyme A synthetase/AMP-(fatty) acid ligase
MTIREQVLDLVERNGDRVFLVDAFTGQTISYREFHQLACALGADLRARGLRRGDRLGVMVPNGCELAVLYFACLYAGATIVPINPNLSAGDVRFILSSCDPRLVIASGSLCERVVAAGRTPIALVTAHDAPAGSQFSAIDLKSLSPAEFHPLQEATAEDLLVIVFTSGTTAKPKGLAHRIGRMFRNARAFAQQQGIDHSARFYLTLSMAYMGGFYNLLILPFLHGASVVIDHVFDARSSLSFWERASRHQANALWLAPTVMSILLKMDRGHLGEEFCRRSVRRAFVGFAPLPLKLKADFEARYGVQVIENYGLSETLFVTARSNANGSGTGYVGEVLPGIDLRIVGDDGDPLPPHADGEIQILTPDLMAGYLDEKGRLKEVEAGAWFATGDFGHLDESGALLVTGRKKDIIIRGGVNISPAAIEEALLHVKGIVDASVVSIPHELYGEDIVAVLKLEPGLELESMLDGIVEHARQELAAHQQPARYVAIDDFPRTANGKVQKSQLRELVVGKLQLGSGSFLRTRPADAVKA